MIWSLLLDASTLSKVVWHDMMEELLIIERLDLLCDISV